MKKNRQSRRKHKGFRADVWDSSSFPWLSVLQLRAYTGPSTIRSWGSWGWNRNNVKEDNVAAVVIFAICIFICKFMGTFKLKKGRFLSKSVPW